MLTTPSDTMEDKPKKMKHLILVGACYVDTILT